MTPLKTKTINDRCRVELLVHEEAKTPNQHGDSLTRLYCWYPGYRFTKHDYPDLDAFKNALVMDPDMHPALVRDLFMIPPPDYDYHIELRMGDVMRENDRELRPGEQLVGAVLITREDYVGEGFRLQDIQSAERIALDEVDRWQRFCNAQVYCLLFKTLDEDGPLSEFNLAATGDIYDISDQNLDDELMDLLPPSLYDEIKRAKWETP